MLKAHGPCQLKIFLTRNRHRERRDTHCDQRLVGDVAVGASVVSFEDGTRDLYAAGKIIAIAER